ncbi:MAG: flagellar export chaperone FliS [Burkholderiaceae bacterium]|jgi:flagellar protein FliS|nr:flagellar export chaperone FliS [Burkholderiaceae bacterium]
MYQTASRPRADAYRRIGVETSMHTIDQHQIIVLLYDGLLQEIARARGALARQDVPAKCDAITRALRILQEGLMTGLDLVEGGEIAQNLNALYEYCAHQLVMANARNDDARLQEVYALIEPVAQGWKAIKQPGQGTGG